MFIPIFFRKNSIFYKFNPIDVDFNVLLNPSKDNYEEYLNTISELKVDKTYKTTARNRHYNSDKLLLDYIGENEIFLDLGASEGTTSFELIKKLNNCFKKYYVTDYNLYVKVLSKNNNLYIYNSISNDCILFSKNSIVVYPYQNFFSILFKKLDESLNFKNCELINPELKEESNKNPKIEILEHDIFNTWKLDKPTVIKVANVLNPIYFSDSLIAKAISNIHEALVNNGLLIVIDNRNLNKIEQSSLFRRNKIGFELIKDYNNGTDIKSNVLNFKN